MNRSSNAFAAIYVLSLAAIAVAGLAAVALVAGVVLWGASQLPVLLLVAGLALAIVALVRSLGGQATGGMTTEH